MGLIKAAWNSVTTTFSDQYKEFIYCDSLPPDILMIKGSKRTNSKKSQNVGSDNIISNGSVVAVNDGQFMIIVQQGRIIEFCAEPGEFIFDSSAEPSFFYGNFFKNIGDVLGTAVRRTTFGADTGRDQRVYYVNTKEIIGNKYGTPNPVPFRVVDKNIDLDIDLAIRCHGEYSYRIVNPITFYINLPGNVPDVYRRDSLDSQLRAELLTALQPAFARISAMGIRYSAIPGHTEELANFLNEELSKKWGEKRGIAIAAFGVSSVKASEEDEAIIKDMQKAAVLRNPRMAAARIADAQADAMVGAANNEKAGAFGAFMGMGMANMAGGMSSGNLFNVAEAEEKAKSAQATKTVAVGWKCTCGEVNQGKFCAECGKNKEEVSGWKCACGEINQGKFCAECGARKPEGKLVNKCSKCGWQPEPDAKLPRFCPECGDTFEKKVS